MGSKKIDAVIVLGMHRSGTSCMSEVLMNLGLYPGDSKEFLKASEYNKHGYFENSGVVDCNEKILTKRVAALIKGNHNPLTASLPGRGWIFGAWHKNVLEGESLLTEEVVQSLGKNFFEAFGACDWKPPKPKLSKVPFQLILGEESII